MPSLDDHFNALTKVRPPQGWPDLGEGGTRPFAPPPGRRRRVGVAALALLIAATGFVIAIRAFPRGRAGTPVASVKPAVETPRPSPTDTASATTPSSAPQGGMFAAMLDAIRASSPPGWTFTLNSDRLDGDWRLDGNADDGSGPGRLYVDVTVRPGMIEADPCADQEFNQGARCEERPLSNGDLLVLRDVVIDADGMKTIEVVLIHPDRSGVEAEAGNWTIAALPNGTPISQSDLPTPQVTRADPLYTVDQLAQLVLAVDEGTRECIRTSCK